jgi:glycosyltransferase involved in cell wall biosynthesis
MFSGNATYYANLKSAVERMNDVEATWLPIEINPGEWYAKFPPYSFNWSLLGSTVMRDRVLALERGGKKFDGALFHHQLLGLRLADFMGRVPTVITTDATPLLHDRYAHWYRKTTLVNHPRLNGWKQRPIRNVFQRASYVLPFSQWIRQSVVEEYGIPGNKVIAVPPGIDLHRWATTPKERARRNGRKFLFVGGDFLRKGGDLLLKLAETEFQDCEFHMVTRSFVGKKGQNIFIYDDVEPNTEEMLDLYRKCDVFVLPSRSDFHSIAGLEAMSMSLPMIASEVGSFREIIQDGTTGFVVAIDDERALAACMHKLADDSRLRAAFGAAGRARVEQHYSLDANAMETIGIMKHAVEERRRR